METVIITDSSSDISQEEGLNEQIKLIPLAINFGEEQYREGVDITNEEFYKKLTTGKVLSKTSQPSTGEFLDIFEAVKRENKAAVVILISSKLSGSYENAKIAKEMCGYEHIYIVDSLTTIAALKLLVKEACKKREEMAAKELAAHLDALKTRIRILGIVDTLEYLYKGGRLKKGSAIIGGLLNIKPVITVEEGLVVVMHKPKGFKSAVKYVANYFDEYPVDEDYPVYYQYSMIKDKGEILKAACTQKGIRDGEMSSIGAAVGTHIGPGASAVIYVMKEKKN